MYTFPVWDSDEASEQRGSVSVLTDKRNKLKYIYETFSNDLYWGLNVNDRYKAQFPADLYNLEWKS